MKITIVASMGLNRSIGRNNGLPWQFTLDEVEWFTSTVKDHVVIMGRKTFEILGPVKGYKTIVLSTTKFNYPRGVTWAPNPLHAMAIACLQSEENGTDEIMIVGGGKTFESFLPFASRMRLSILRKVFIADTYFPKYADEDWLMSSQQIKPECRLLTMDRVMK